MLCYTHYGSTRWRHITIIYLYSPLLFFKSYVYSRSLSRTPIVYWNFCGTPYQHTIHTPYHVTNKFEIYLTFPFFIHYYIILLLHYVLLTLKHLLSRHKYLCGPVKIFPSQVKDKKQNTGSWIYYYHIILHHLHIFRRMEENFLNI